MTHNQFTLEQKCTLFLFFTALLLSSPYQILNIVGMYNNLIWLLPVIALFVLTLRKPFNHLPSDFSLCCIFQIVVWFFFFLLHDDLSYITRICFIVISYLMIMTIDNQIGLKTVIKINNSFILIQSFLGAIAFVLFFIGLLSPLFEFSLFDSRPSYFFGITCSNALINNIMRPSGFFDEPGALACWGVYALVINKVFYNNKIVEYILISTLFFTLSLAYYIQLFVYFLLFYSSNLKKVIPIMIIVLLIFAYIISNPSSELYNLTVARLTRMSDGGIQATNRASMFAISQNYFEQSPWIGMGARKVENMGVYSSDNPFETLGTDGIIGTFAMYFPLLFVCFKKLDKSVLYGVLILALGYLQRPFHLNILHFFMMYSFCILALRKNTTKL